jgi:hypothetical protein
MTKRANKRVEFGDGLFALPAGRQNSIGQAFQLGQRRRFVKWLRLPRFGHCSVI